MLVSLHIENIAVVKEVNLDFTQGFMVLTGETGAGKSIIIDSLSLLLGAKADKELIRTGNNSAMVSGVFTNITPFAKSVLEGAGIAVNDDEILIQRSISLDGKSVVKINGRTVTLTVLKQISPALVNIHGQNDTISLSQSESQLDILDLYSDSEQLLSQYAAEFKKLEQIRKELKNILQKEHERERLVEILSYQINDINSYSLKEGEEDELIDRKVKIKNFEKISKNALFAYKALKGSEKGSVSYLIDRSGNALAQISDVIPKFADISEKLRDMLYQIDDMAEQIFDEIGDMEEDSDSALNEIEARLDQISKLKRKYGYTIKDILAFRDNAAAELESLENAEDLINDLESKGKKQYKICSDIADLLHEKRLMSAKEIEERVKDTLTFLDMPKVVFFISVKEMRQNGEKFLNSKGADEAEFFISANRGAEAQPISKIASGGELARIMLALKEVIADKDGIGTVVFDEIDSGVSGKTARKIGLKMLSISKSSQLIVITHSAQIASVADEHYLISKSDKDGETKTEVNILDREGRIKELSRILGGIDVTDSQRLAAVDMLDNKEEII